VYCQGTAVRVIPADDVRVSDRWDDGVERTIHLAAVLRPVARASWPRQHMTSAASAGESTVAVDQRGQATR
jgi:hypothetical protein